VCSNCIRGFRNKTLERPDRLIIDLDPDPSFRGSAWSPVPSRSATDEAPRPRDLRQSTGGKGLHVVAPIDPNHEWPAFKEFAHHFVLMMERANPKLLPHQNDQVRPHWPHLPRLSSQRARSDRRGAVFAACPRRRACRRALTWAELERTDPKQFAAANFDEWKARLKRDPWLRMKT